MKKALLQMHLAVFLWGFTGVLGRGIHTDAFSLVWFRTGITSLLFLVILLLRKEFRALSRMELLRFLMIGSIIAIHWVAFYAAIKVANASIALTCLSTAGIFTAILEPLILKTKMDYRELVIGMIALIGMYLIYRGNFSFGPGIMLGIGAAILSAVFTVLNKKIVIHYPSNLVAFCEIGFGFLVLSILLPFYFFYYHPTHFAPSGNDWLLLVVLSFFCTVLGQSLAISALKKLSSFTTVLMVNLEPVYGILLAMIIFKENKELNTAFYIGISIIALSVAIHSIQIIRHRGMKPTSG